MTEATNRQTTATAIVCDVTPKQLNDLVQGNGHVFVVIVTQPLTRVHKDSFVMITSAPLRAIATRNQPHSPYRDMRDKIPYLYPEFVAGPFRVFELATDYADQLVVGRRGLPSKVKHGCQLALTFDVPCYHINVTPPEGFDLFLRDNHAPLLYVNASRRIGDATRVLQSFCNGDLTDAVQLPTPTMHTTTTTTDAHVPSWILRVLLGQIFRRAHAPQDDAGWARFLGTAWNGEPIEPIVTALGAFWKAARLFSIVTADADFSAHTETCALLLLGLCRFRARHAAKNLVTDAHPKWLRRVADYLLRWPKKSAALADIGESLAAVLARAPDATEKEEM